MSQQKKICYVIMPFAKTKGKRDEAYWTTHFGLLKRIIQEIPGLEAIRSQPLRGNVLSEIISRLLTSPVVVADLTDLNPNVFWELGVRQSRMHGTVTIALEGTRRPFDIGHKAILSYSRRSTTRWEEFREQFKSAIKDCLDNPNVPDSPVLESTTGRGTLFEIIRRDETSRRLDALISEIMVNESGFHSIVEKAKSNQENTENRGYPVLRERTPATELLITNRYLDADESFYNLAGAYYNRMISLDDQMNSWENSPDITEKLILKWSDESRSDFTKIMREFKEKVGTSRNKLRSNL